MSENSGSMVAEYINIELPKQEKAREIARNYQIYELFLLESMRYEDQVNQQSREEMVSGDSCWNNIDIYSICNCSENGESYWTEMSYYLYDND